YPISGRSAAIARGLKIDGNIPFKEASSFILPRIWVDQYNVESRREPGKHDLKPSQIEKNRWNIEAVRDTNGYYDGRSYYFYFEAGSRNLTLTAVREPVVIAEIKLYNKTTELSYKETLQLYQAAGYSEIDSALLEGGYYKVQGENAYEKSAPTLAPTANWSSFKVDPYEKFITRYNTIGGYGWRVAGDWITWEVEAPTSGFYRLTFKVLQNHNRGMDSTRILYINGAVPFSECRNIRFRYSGDWQNATLGNGEEDYLFYLKAGRNTITLEATIGVYDNVIRTTEQTIVNLNRLYRKVVMITGVAPDKYQDYLLKERIQDLYEMINDSIEKLEFCVDEIIGIAGERSNLIGTFERTLLQLRRFIKSEQNIQRSLKELEDNVAALGTWVMNISEQPLSVDCIYLQGVGSKLPNASTNFFQKLWHEIVMLIGSFGVNTSLESSVKADGPTITIWVFSGRDQSQLLRQLIDESFTRDKQINVKLKLVNATALLPATLSGNGPDVALGVGQNIPVNWGIRQALVDLTQFDDFSEVAERFSNSAITPFCFQDAVYALPDTEDFLVTFVRSDIADEMGFTVPKTWNEVLALVPALQRSYLDYYIPNTRGALSTLMYAMIVQNGGELYQSDGKKTSLMERASTEAFIDFTSFFTDYGFAVHANFPNRFRSGEMPIGIYNYSLYNTLSVFAPEIRGQWQFAPLPGYEKAGVINNQTTSTVTGSVILADSKEKTASWEFLKWWLSAETQTGYSRGMEAILGAAARYPTANLTAFKNLPWSVQDYYILEQQRKKAAGVPTVPGDYIVGRYLDNAFRSAINNNLNPRDTLFEYAQKIDIEIMRKRKEFNLD
ncbi:MAG: extracellular solute-binding protein, partial [Bacilli bacterium]|nr:extracellular solute-binding protein [Bacilli bacterium]